MRLLVLIVAGFLFSGCSSPPSSYDPFLGRTTVPPPGTMQAPPPGTMPPYYQGAPAPNGAPLPRTTPAPGTTPIAPPGSPPPPGAYGVPQSRYDWSKAVRPGPGEYRAGQSAVARRSPVVQVPGQWAGTTALATADSGPGAVRSGSTPPAAGQVVSWEASAANGGVSSGAHMSSSGADDRSSWPSSQTGPQPAATPAAIRYGDRSSNQWLPGRLE